MKTIYFSCFTPYQLFNCMYYAYKLPECRRVLIWHDFANYGIDTDSLKQYFDEIMLIPCQTTGNTFSRQWKRLVCSGHLFGFSEVKRALSAAHDSVMLLFSDQEACTNKQVRAFLKNREARNNDAILVEEGIGIYNDGILKLSKRGSLCYKLLGMKYVSCIGASGLYSRVYVKQPELLDRGRFGNKPVKQQNNMLLDRGFVESLPFETPQGEKKRHIMFLGLPFYELGITEEEYLGLLRDTMAADPDIKLLYKPHPREDISYVSKLEGLEVWRCDEAAWMPAEVVALKIRPEAVVSVASSAAHNIYDLMPDVKMIFLYPLLQKKIINEDIFKQYETMVNSFVPRTVDEIAEAVKCRLQPRSLGNVNQDEELNDLRSLLADMGGEEQNIL